MKIQKPSYGKNNISEKCVPILNFSAVYPYKHHFEKNNPGDF